MYIIITIIVVIILIILIVYFVYTSGFLKISQTSIERLIHNNQLQSGIKSPLMLAIFNLESEDFSEILVSIVESIQYAAEYYPNIELGFLIICTESNKMLWEHCGLRNISQIIVPSLEYNIIFEILIYNRIITHTLINGYRTLFILENRMKINVKTIKVVLDELSQYNVVLVNDTKSDTAYTTGFLNIPKRINISSNRSSQECIGSEFALVAMDNKTLLDGPLFSIDAIGGRMSKEISWFLDLFKRRFKVGILTSERLTRI